MYHLMKQAALLPALMLTHLFASAQQPVTEQLSVYFDTDKSELTANSRKTLTDFLAHIDTIEGAQLTISGHTDARASQAYNDLLSQRRVGSVMSFLNTHKLSELPQITSNLAEGENRPAAGNVSAKDMALNRRVEITLTYPEKSVVAEKPKTDNIQDLYKRLAPKPSTYCIDNTRDTLLACEKGTVVLIPAFCFSQEKKQPCTTISVLEALSMSDMLLQNLSTESDGRLLETGGMVDIHAFDPKGNELELIDQKALTFFFPADSASGDFSTFYGDRDSTVHQTVNWRVPNMVYLVDSASVPFSYWTNCTDLSYDECSRCKLFCRMRRITNGFAGAFSTDIRKDNRKFRDCQRRLRKGQSVKKYAPSSDCQQVNSYFTRWNVTPDTNAFKTLYADFLEKNGFKSARDYIFFRQRQADSIQAVIRKQNDSLQAMRQELYAKSFNIIQSMQMGMINCDRFTGSGKELAEVRSNVNATPDIDGKLIFTNIKSIMPAYRSADFTYGFPNIPKRSTSWMFFLKLDGEQAYLSLEKVTAGQSEPFEVKFRKVSDAEIVQALKALDR